jgi:hypothetical protein
MYAGEPINVAVSVSENCWAPAVDLRDPEVQDLDHALTVRPAGEEQIGRLEIPVDDAALMRLGHRFTRLHHVVHGYAHR